MQRLLISKLWRQQSCCCRLIQRTAGYGPVRPVVWEGRSREAPPYPDIRSYGSQYRPERIEGVGSPKPFGIAMMTCRDAEVERRRPKQADRGQCKPRLKVHTAALANVVSDYAGDRQLRIWGSLKQLRESPVK